MRTGRTIPPLYLEFRPLRAGHRILHRAQLGRQINPGLQEGNRGALGGHLQES